MNPDEFVPVYTLADPNEAEMIKNELNDEGIRCFIDGENQGSLAGLIGFDIKIMVPAADAERAYKILHSRTKEPAPEEEEE